jgi:16S rRNA (cytidine1402-2'-O)-methyltransferase
MRRCGRRGVSGRLVLCATPIGNLEDVTLRLLRVLGEADVVACEDVGRARRLLTHHSVSPHSLVVLNEGNERRRTAELGERIRRGATVALISAAGMPAISDPGYRLVRVCVEAGWPVEVVPGPSAAVSALIVSGLPPDRFVFEGWLPRKVGDRRRRIEEWRDERRTIVAYVSPHRLGETLVDLLGILGARPAALVRELTKVHEEVVRGTLEDLAEHARREPPRGEMVLVVGGAIRGRDAPEAPELARRAHELMRAGTARKEAMSRVAREAGVRRRDVFDALVEEGGEGSPSG